MLSSVKLAAMRVPLTFSSDSMCALSFEGYGGNIRFLYQLESVS